MAHSARPLAQHSQGRNPAHAPKLPAPLAHLLATVPRYHAIGQQGTSDGTWPHTRTEHAGSRANGFPPPCRHRLLRPARRRMQHAHIRHACRCPETSHGEQMAVAPIAGTRSGMPPHHCIRKSVRPARGPMQQSAALECDVDLGKRAYTLVGSKAGLWTSRTCT